MIFSNSKWDVISKIFRTFGFADYNTIALVNTKEVYRLTATVNKALSGTNVGGVGVSSPAQVTLFLERLTTDQ